GYDYLPQFGHWVLTSVTEPSPTGSGAGPRTQYGYDLTTGLLTSVTDPAGSVTSLTYDFSESISTITRPAGGDTGDGSILDITTIVPSDEAGLANTSLGQGTQANPAPAPPGSNQVYYTVQQSYTTASGTFSRQAEVVYVDSYGDP